MFHLVKGFYEKKIEKLLETGFFTVLSLKSQGTNKYLVTLVSVLPMQSITLEQYFFLNGPTASSSFRSSLQRRKK